MTEKEKAEIKKEIVSDLFNCFEFDFINTKEILDKNKILALIGKYSNEIRKEDK